MSEIVALIGAGQLGSRHLQGLAKVERALDIYLVDPSAASLALSVERYNAVATCSDTKVTPLQSVADLPRAIDVAIVATTANVRFDVLNQLMAHSQVGSFLLEKVLFQDLAHYEQARQLLRDRAARTWVNCAQRLWPFFIDLRRQYVNDPDLEIVVTGSNWGLGCNSIHNTDIAHFLWEGHGTHAAALDKDILNSKRPGFHEFTGELVSTFASGGRLRQISYARGNAPFCFHVFHPSQHLVWDVSNGKLHTADESSQWMWQPRDLAAPFQSQLTATIVTQMLDGVDCGLPAYDEAAATHMATLTALLDAARTNGTNFGTCCPIT
jgi:hypothetical protein